MTAAPGFVAFIHDDAASPAVDTAVAALGLSGARRVPTADGWLTLWRGEDGNSGDMLVIADGTGGAPSVAVPRDVVQEVPAELSVQIAQHRSYLWLDRERRVRVWTDHTGVSRLYAAAFQGCLAISDCPSPLAALAPELD